MSEIYLNTLGDTHAKWLSVRQTLIASNIANANVSGFKAQDVQPLSESKQSFSNLVRTNEQHLTSRLGNVEGVGTTTSGGWETFHSGTSVNVAQEMIKSSEVASAYQLNTSVMRSFHTMVLSTFGN